MDDLEPVTGWCGSTGLRLKEVAPDPPFAAELMRRVFTFEALNVLSEVYKLRDGRWGFYEPIYHRPALQRRLDDPEVAYFCRKGVFQGTVESAEISAAAEAWIRSMRTRHGIAIDDAAAAKVAARVRRASDG